jgi:hypothetical protein
MCTPSKQEVGAIYSSLFGDPELVDGNTGRIWSYNSPSVSPTTLTIERDDELLEAFIRSVSFDQPAPYRGRLRPLLWLLGQFSGLLPKRTGILVADRLKPMLRVTIEGHAR